MMSKLPHLRQDRMARTKQTARKSVGGTAPRDQRATPPAPQPTPPPATDAPSDAAAATAAPAPAAGKNAAKQAESDAANAAKDRKLARPLLTGLDELDELTTGKPQPAAAGKTGTSRKRKLDAGASVAGSAAAAGGAAASSAAASASGPAAKVSSTPTTPAGVSHAGRGEERLWDKTVVWLHTFTCALSMPA